jgi:hypothetical protein
MEPSVGGRSVESVDEGVAAAGSAVVERKVMEKGRIWVSGGRSKAGWPALLGGGRAGEPDVGEAEKADLETGIAT